VISGLLTGIWILLVIVLLLAGVLLNLMGFAGNWLMLLTMTGHRLISDPASRWGVNWETLFWILLIAALAEGIEFLSGIKGAGSTGASRRSMILSMIGSLIGASFGFGVGNAVVPVVGGIVGVILLGAAGAFAGALLGETWKGREFSIGLEAGRGAFRGRLIGTISKAFLGTLILVISLAALLF
jgi:uncharacterized protein YqgC (DUF456 family)